MDFCGKSAGVIQFSKRGTNTGMTKHNYSQWPKPISLPGLPPVAGEVPWCHMPSSVRLAESQSLWTTSVHSAATQSTTFDERTGSAWRRRCSDATVGVTEEQRRWSLPAPVTGLPRLSFPGDQSLRNSLLSDCCTNQLFHRPLGSCLSVSLCLHCCRM